ncbi:MAG: sensor histidine kinase [Vicinamibacterales bacterium]
MKAPTRRPPSSWHGSFYWRIGISFVVFVLAVLVTQSVMFSYILARTSAQNPAFSPNNLATAVAADVGSALETNPGLDVRAYLPTRYGREPWRLFVVMRDGSVSGNSAEGLSDDIRRSAESALRGTDVRQGDGSPRLSGPVVTAPIQVRNELQGLVVLPPPPPGGIMRDVGRLLSLPGTILLIVATVAAVVVIFAPARRRLSALEDAAERLGRGDLAARAPDNGGDEIARVSRAFNRMADDLAARDEALRTSDRLRRQMLADVSHELKTPLTAMRGYVETLRMPEVALDDDRRARYLETIESETLRLDRIVKDLLDLARYESREVPIEVRVFDIGRVFHHVVRRHEHETRERRIAVSLEIEDAAGQIVADPDRIEQVIENLMTNAVRHTPERGRIELGAAMADGSAVLSVADSGDGIAPEHLPYVFDRFYKVDPARAAGGAGSGLGLSIAKAIVGRHGGTIDVTSAPGSTRFTIVLPQPPQQTS